MTGKRLFGTDGIRGVAGEGWLAQPAVRSFGAALAEVVCAEAGGGRACVVLGRDTRQSGQTLRDAVAAGLAARDVRAVDAGVISTPGLAHVLVDCGFAAGVMISASHNPYRDNGLKAFGADGFKLSDELERRIEGRLLDEALPDPGPRPGAVAADEALCERYVRFLEGRLPAGRLRRLRLVLDCANGSASAIAPRVFRELGAEVIAIGDAPDGRNINLACGSLHLDDLALRVRAERCDLGLAFDGDADRCLAVDRRGRTIDGDHILYLAARHLARRGQLAPPVVVATIMSNLWLELSLGQLGIELRRAAVGDKYVLAMMLDEDVQLGGEQSGHVIFRHQATTGDGMLTGLMLLDAVLDEERPLETILDGIRPCPQELRSVPVAVKPDLKRHPRIGPAVAAIERELDGTGRVVLRYSGTEPLARVMIEAVDPDAVRRHVESLARLIAEELGSESGG